VSRIDRTFARLKQEQRTGLVTYVTAGDPDLEHSEAILLALERAGADVLEVGIPFSDPLADGPVIQRASERALAAGTTTGGVIDMVARLRPRLAAPVVLFSYVNPILRLGLDAFARRAADAGVDGVLALDLPIEEAGDYHAALTAAGIDPIFLLSPTTTPVRVREAARLGRGFLYVISRLGVTGARDALAPGTRDLVARIRRETALPVALGFGISRPEHVVEAGRSADAAVVGSGLVGVIAATEDPRALASRVDSYVRWLKGETEVLTA
jgi:tryptophan synthase alpha chain